MYTLSCVPFGMIERISRYTGWNMAQDSGNISKLPVAAALDSEIVEFKDSPEDWGLPEDLGTLGSHAKGTWDRQQRYLSHYAREPFQSRSAKAAGISAETARLWAKGNVLRFNDRLTSARATFDGSLETLLLDMVRGERPNALLVMFALKKFIPSYRETAQPIDGTARDVLDAITAGTKHRLASGAE